MLVEQIDKDLKEALKGKDAVRVSTLRLLKSGIENARIAKKAEKLADPDVLQVIAKQIKSHDESIAQFEKGGRDDLVQKEKQEREILKSYMPMDLSEDEIQAKIAQAIEETGAQSRKDMGKVMKILMDELRGQVDGNKLSQLVSAELEKLQEK